MKQSVILAIGLAALIGTPIHSAFAADMTAGVLTKEGPDLWRASKLAGVAIYGPDDKKVGSISDVLVGKDGKSQYIIVGVGGFLGLGQKDVAIAYDKVQFTDQPVRVEPAEVTGTTATPGTAGGLGAAPDATMKTPANTAATGNAMAPSTTAMAANPPLSYPDHGKIDLTADQLKAAPSFTFTR